MTKYKYGATQHMNECYFSPCVVGNTTSLITQVQSPRSWSVHPDTLHNCIHTYLIISDLCGVRKHCSNSNDLEGHSGAQEMPLFSGSVVITSLCCIISKILPILWHSPCDCHWPSTAFQFSYNSKNHYIANVRFSHALIVHFSQQALHFLRHCTDHTQLSISVSL